MVTLALGDFVSLGSALTAWLVTTAVSLVGYLLARRPLVCLASASTLPPAPPGPSPSVPAPASQIDPAAALDQRWARTLLHYWGRTNLLLLLGAAVVGSWYWLAAGAR